MTKCALFLLFFLSFVPLWSQKTYTAAQLSTVPVLDGIPDDSCWSRVSPLAIALTSRPVFGQPALPSTVRLFYTDDALYVAATFSGSVPRPDGSQRDATETADWFSIGLDTWDDDQNAFVFTITAAGVQSESRVGSNEATPNWDAIWQSAVAQQDSGWSVEIRLPFTALRFPVRAEQHWGAQFSRYDRRSGTLSTWSPQQPLIQDAVLQYGALEGLRNIPQHRRLSAEINSQLDQSSSYTENNFSYSTTQATLGIDGRWGINSASTLDIAFLPSTSFYRNFDQCVFCADQLTRWQQNVPLLMHRQLPQEERPMFDKSEIFWEIPTLDYRNADLSFGETLIKYNRSKIWTSAKFSTRLPGNVGVGVYTTFFSPSSVEVLPITDPGSASPETRPITSMANYTLITVEKALRNNSWISLTNAGTWGKLPPFTNNLSSLAFQLREPGNQYQLAGSVQVNVPELNDTFQKAGSQYRFSVAKVNGPWTWRLSQEKNKAILHDILNADPSFPNDHYYSNSIGELSFRDFRPQGWRQNTQFAFQINKKWRQAPGNFNPLSALASISVLNQHFQFLSIILKSDLQKKPASVLLCKQPPTYSRLISLPVLAVLLSFRRA